MKSTMWSAIKFLCRIASISRDMVYGYIVLYCMYILDNIVDPCVKLSSVYVYEVL